MMYDLSTDLFKEHSRKTFLKDNSWLSFECRLMTIYLSKMSYGGHRLERSFIDGVIYWSITQADLDAPPIQVESLVFSSEDRAILNSNILSYIFHLILTNETHLSTISIIDRCLENFAFTLWMGSVFGSIQNIQIISVPLIVEEMLKPHIGKLIGNTRWMLETEEPCETCREMNHSHWIKVYAISEEDLYALETAVLRELLYVYPPAGKGSMELDDVLIEIKKLPFTTKLLGMLGEKLNSSYLEGMLDSHTERITYTDKDGIEWLLAYKNNGYTTTLLKVPNGKEDYVCYERKDSIAILVERGFYKYELERQIKYMSTRSGMDHSLRYIDNLIEGNDFKIAKSDKLLFNSKHQQMYDRLMALGLDHETCQVFFFVKISEKTDAYNVMSYVEQKMDAILKYYLGEQYCL
jgi:hypothetical protein